MSGVEGTSGVEGLSGVSGVDGLLGTWRHLGDIIRCLDTRIGICREERTEVLQVDAVYLAGVKGDERLVGTALGDEELTYGDEASYRLCAQVLYTGAGVDIFILGLVVHLIIKVSHPGVHFVVDRYDDVV